MKQHPRRIPAHPPTRALSARRGGARRLPERSFLDVETRVSVAANDSTCMAAGLFVAGPVAPGAGGAQGFPDGRQWLTAGVADFGADARLQWASRGAVMAEALNVRDPAKVGRPRRAPPLLLGPV
jgi:hypothetical protein